MNKGRYDEETEARFEALYRNYFPKVFRFFRNRFRLQDSDAQDLAQETFLKIYESFLQYRGEAKWSYIEIVARRTLLNWVRAADAAKRKMELVALDDPAVLQPSVPAEAADLGERQQHEQRLAATLAAIAELPTGQRACMELSLKDLDHKAIASVLGTTVDAVKSRLRDARRALRERLGEDLPEVDE